jgi:hypothetical protein
MKQKTRNLLKLRPEGKTSETDAHNYQSLFINGPGFSASGNPEERMVLDWSFISLKRKQQKNTSTGSQSRENSKDPMDVAFDSGR